MDDGSILRRGSHLVDLDSISMEGISGILNLAHEIEAGKVDLSGSMKGKLLIPLFFQESSRTFTNSTSSFIRMGGSVLAVNVENTRLNKRWREPIRDFCQLINSCCDYAIVRAADAGTVLEFSKWCERPLINAGNGSGSHSEHPVQALIDAYVLRKRFGSRPLKILILGGRHVRSTRSQVKLFKRLGHSVDLIAYGGDEDNSDIEPFYKANCKEFDDVRSVDISQHDVLLHNGADEDPRVLSGDKVSLNSELLLRKDFKGIVLHSLPRLAELSRDLDDTPFNFYFDQMRSSKFIFQSVFANLLDRERTQKG